MHRDNKPSSDVVGFKVKCSFSVLSLNQKQFNAHYTSAAGDEHMFRFSGA